MTPDSCPTPEDLRSFVRCSLTEDQADSISEHLDQCGTCEETVAGLERGGNTISDRIKDAAALPSFAHEPECQQLLQRMLEAAIAGSPESADGEDTPAI